MIPITSTEHAITHLARSFGGALGYDPEVFGFWIGTVPDRLTHLILPEYLIGIGKVTSDAMDHTTNTRSRAEVMFAIESGSSEPGIMVHIDPDSCGGEHTEGRWVFIPHELLILNRPIAAYLPTDTREEYFPGVSPDTISPMDIATVINMSENKQHIHLSDHNNHWYHYDFVSSLGIQVDAFVSNSRIYPMNRFILGALGTNRFTRTHDGERTTIYGRVHIHYAYRFREIVGDPLINALNRNDKYFYELMTPVDAISLLDSAKAVREISKRQRSMAQQIEAIVAIDPKSLEVVGRSFFDLQILESAAEIKKMRGFARRASQSRDINVHLQWFDYIRPLSTAQFP